MTPPPNAPDRWRKEPPATYEVRADEVMHGVSIWFWRNGPDDRPHFNLIRESDCEELKIKFPGANVEWWRIASPASRPLVVEAARAAVPVQGDLLREADAFHDGSPLHDDAAYRLARRAVDLIPRLVAALRQSAPAVGEALIERLRPWVFIDRGQPAVRLSDLRAALRPPAPDAVPAPVREAAKEALRLDEERRMGGLSSNEQNDMNRAALVLARHVLAGIEAGSGKGKANE